MSRFSYLYSTKNWLIAGACFLMILEAFRTLVDNVHVVINRTDSLPIKAFVHLRHQVPHKGDYTLVSSSRYGRRLVKRVIAEAGETISYDKEGTLYVGTQEVGKPKHLSKTGQILTPIKEQVIPEGHVFLYAPHQDSFDSRYEELGLIHQNALQGRAVPVI